MSTPSEPELIALSPDFMVSLNLLEDTVASWCVHQANALLSRLAPPNTGTHTSAKKHADCGGTVNLVN